MYAQTYNVLKWPLSTFWIGESRIESHKGVWVSGATHDEFATMGVVRVFTKIHTASCRNCTLHVKPGNSEFLEARIRSYLI